MIGGGSGYTDGSQTDTWHIGNYQWGRGRGHGREASYTGMYSLWQSVLQTSKHKLVSGQCFNKSNMKLIVHWNLRMSVGFI